MYIYRHTQLHVDTEMLGTEVKLLLTLTENDKVFLALCTLSKACGYKTMASSLCQGMGENGADDVKRWLVYN